MLAATGPAVALCSFTTVVGYASLLFSENQGIRSFGLSALIGELTCVFAALVLAPVLLDLPGRRRPAAIPEPVAPRGGRDHPFVTTCRVRRTTPSKTSAARRAAAPRRGARRT